MDGLLLWEAAKEMPKSYWKTKILGKSMNFCVLRILETWWKRDRFGDLREPLTEHRYVSWDIQWDIF